jgi:hypothetical protein
MNVALNYIMESRPEKGLFVYMHDEQPRAHGEEVPRGYRGIELKKTLERDHELGVRRHTIDCEEPWCSGPIREMASTWRLAVMTTAKVCHHIWAHYKDDIIRATGLIGDGDDGEWDVSVQDTLRTLSSLEVVLQDQRSAKRRGEARHEGPPKLADFGAKAWPRDPAVAFQSDMTASQLRTGLVELAWRLVDHVAVQVQGKTACLTSVPMLDPLPGYVSPDYATRSSYTSEAASSATAKKAALGAPSCLTGFVLCVWAVYEAQRTQEGRRFSIMSVHHKASVEESAGEEGVTWWSRACNADREAIILLDSKEADGLLQDAEVYTRPPKPKAPPLYCYIGCGVDRQPECITGMVVRTNDPALTAAVATACRILSLNFSDDMAVEVTSERIVAEAAMQPALEDLLTRIGNMWVPWAEMPQPHGMLEELISVTDSAVRVGSRNAGP